MQRRRLIQAAGFTALPFHSLQAKGPLAGRIKIAVKYHMITEPAAESVLDKFQLLQAIGFDGVELRTADKVDSAEIKSAIDQTGLPVHGIVNASNPDIVSAVELADQLGADSVLVLAAAQKNFSYQQNVEHWQALVNKALPLAEEKQISLCIENVRATFLLKAEQMIEFIDSFDSPWVRSYFDLGNTITWTEQSAQHWAEVLGKRVYKLDIKDRGHPEFGEAKLAREGAIGTNAGEVHWQKVRQLLDQNQYSGWATAEVRGGDKKRLAGIATWMRDVLDLV